MFILPIAIVLSSLKAFGYVFSFIFYLPYIYKKREIIFFTLRKSNRFEKLVFIYLIFILLEVIYGSLFIKDFRIILYWVPFVLSLTGIYFLNINEIKSNNFYKSNFLNIIFNASLIYFIFYFIMNIISFFYGEGFYSLQDNLWIGSSGAFSVTSILFYSGYKLWEKIKFKLFSKYTYSLLFYIWLVNLNESRVGLFYLLGFSFFVFLRNLQLKNIKNIIMIPIIIFSFYSLCTFSLGEFHNNLSDKQNYYIEKHKSRTIIRDTANIFNHDDQRKDEFVKGIRKFKEYPLINKLIGTGWYSSRITINLDKSEIINPKLSYNDKKVTYLQGVIAILLDTGILGIIFSLSLVFINLINIYKSKEYLINRFFFLFLFLLNLGCLFLGYPIVNLAFVIFILPSGIIYFDNNYG